MKKILVISSLFLLTMTSCMKDEIIEPYTIDVPESLFIDNIQGLKLESFIVLDEVQMNVKLASAGTYRIKIKDFSGEIVSQEKITAESGDNILKVYVSSLSKDSYTIELTTNGGDIIGKSTFVVN